ncbi:MAG: zf-HC2 domain-containing protein, partial [Dongiaceae bacterium]
MSIFFVRHPGEHDLALFAGGELGPVGRWRIEGHLEGCGRCRQVVTEFFEVRGLVMDLAELPHLNWAAMAAGIQARLRQAPQAAGWRPAWGVGLAAATVIVAGAYVTSLLEPAQPVSLDATASAVEMRVGERAVLTLVNAARDQT